jgi:hypothetical protein
MYVMCLVTGECGEVHHKMLHYGSILCIGASRDVRQNKE